MTLNTLTLPADPIYRTADGLLGRVGPSGRPIRLLGVRRERLDNADRVTEQRQFDATDPRAARNSAEGARDRVMTRFGEQAVNHGSLIDGPSPDQVSPNGNHPALEVPAADSYS